MFKTTIDKLRQENTELHKNLELQSDKIFACQPKKYENKLKLIKPLSNDDLRVMNSYKSSKIQILKGNSLFMQISSNRNTSFYQFCAKLMQVDI